MSAVLAEDPVEKREMLYEGKAKRMWTTDDPALMVMEYKDSLTAFDATKKGQFGGKGAINNRISALIMGELNRLGIENNFVRLIDESNSLVRRVEIVPIEVIVRYEAQGSICKRYGITPGLKIDPPLCEIGLKNDELHDPYFTDDIASLMGLATREELVRMRYMALVTGEKLREIYGRCNIEIKDFKLEFGRVSENGAQKIILADEVTPDTCRLIDKRTGEKLDKDLFRFDLGDVDAGYHKLLEMIEKVLG
jgi:phosphoribosylaminoimidazole-succinocarboxamide synthase